MFMSLTRILLYSIIITCWFLPRTISSRWRGKIVWTSLMRKRSSFFPNRVLVTSESCGMKLFINSIRLLDYRVIFQFYLLLWQLCEINTLNLQFRLYLSSITALTWTSLSLLFLRLQHFRLSLWRLILLSWCTSFRLKLFYCLNYFLVRFNLGFITYLTWQYL